MHTIVVDLGFGDAGKGSIVDWLASPAATRVVGLANPPAAVVRFNGGAQAGHNVVTPDGRHHCFAQFGASTLHGIPTLLSRHMLVEPHALAAEAHSLAALGVPDPLRLLHVDVDALLTTPYHAAVNRARETARGAGPHGSCGMGIGETVAHHLAHPGDAPTVGHTANPPRLRKLLHRLREWAHATCSDLLPDHSPRQMPTVAAVADVYAHFSASVNLVDTGFVRQLARRGRLIFEGAQGVLLDQTYGFHPHTTWSRTTFGNAFELLAEAGVDVNDRDHVLRLGVTRTYATRHGAGPFVSHDPALLRHLPEPHNHTGRWQGAFRVGHLDLVALRYATDVCGGLDAIAVTHLDTAYHLQRAKPGTLQIADAWRIDDAICPIRRLPIQPQPERENLTRLAFHAAPVLRDGPADWTTSISDELGAPTLVESWGPTWTDKLHAKHTAAA